ncbi:TadE/TadG family type IV pilus assembly protein [Paraburkholderia azotifigens]|uniref:TadE/TadG family type IV pilus assembly protein n=1 Tax=Paraburkholderia azotifigens TaxID=2057004 RepID=UPI00316EA542
MTTTRARSRVPSRRRSGRARSGRSQAGVAAIEFALIAPVLFFLLCMVMDLGAALWVNLTMQ